MPTVNLNSQSLLNLTFCHSPQLPLLSPNTTLRGGGVGYVGVLGVAMEVCTPTAVLLLEFCVLSAPYFFCP